MCSVHSCLQVLKEVYNLLKTQVQAQQSQFPWISDLTILPNKACGQIPGSAQLLQTHSYKHVEIPLVSSIWCIPGTFASYFIYFFFSVEGVRGMVLSLQYTDNTNTFFRSLGSLKIDFPKIFLLGTVVF